MLGFLFLTPGGIPGLVSLASTTLPPPHVRGTVLSIDGSRPQCPSGAQFLCWALPSLGSRNPQQEASVLSFSDSKFLDLPLPRVGKNTRRGQSFISSTPPLLWFTSWPRPSWERASLFPTPGPPSSPQSAFALSICVEWATRLAQASISLSKGILCKLNFYQTSWRVLMFFFPWIFENTRHIVAFVGSDGIGRVGLFHPQVLEFQVGKVLCKPNTVLKVCSFFL